ncbi:MAG: DoxX family protein [Candidatus Acidiferrales bacterium]
MRALEHLKPLSLLVLRVALGVVFMYHGYPKILGDPKFWVGAFGHMGFPPYFAYIAGILEFFGGILLILGLFTRVAALLLAIEMGIAIGRVHIPQSGIYAIAKYELPLVLCGGAFALATVGAGLISVDNFTFEGGRKAPKKSKP